VFVCTFRALIFLLSRCIGYDFELSNGDYNSFDRLRDDIALIPIK